MSENLVIDNKLTKEEKYVQLMPQLEGLVFGEPNFIANVSNIIAALKYGLGFFWVGLYLAEEDELVLGPFQGPIACTRIPKGKGVCGLSFEREETIIVDNVDEFLGHIACSADSKSEIVVPILDKSGKLFGIIDIDSDVVEDFDSIDKKYLEQVATLITGLI